MPNFGCSCHTASRARHPVSDATFPTHVFGIRQVDVRIPRSAAGYARRDVGARPRNRLRGGRHGGTRLRGPDDLRGFMRMSSSSSRTSLRPARRFSGSIRACRSPVARASTPASPRTNHDLPEMLERLYGSDLERLRREIRRVVLHEIAHHSGSATSVSRSRRPLR